MQKSTVIGLAAGVAILGAGWLLYGKQLMAILKGNAATVRQAAKAIAPKSAAVELRRPAQLASTSGSQAMQAAPGIKGALSGRAGAGADGFMVGGGGT